MRRIEIRTADAAWLAEVVVREIPRVGEVVLLADPERTFKVIGVRHDLRQNAVGNHLVTVLAEEAK